MNKTKQLIAGLLIVALAAGGLVLYNNRDNNTSKSNTETSQSAVDQTVKPTLTISEDQKSVKYEGQAGKTALELLNAGAEIKTESSDFGDFVIGINGVEADSAVEYWSFYVNGEYASEGAGTYQTSDGDQIEWKLEQL
jgi:hypothetical protein